MQVFLGTLVVFAIAMLAMAAGVMLSGRALEGSCGGTGTACPCTEEERRSCARRAKGGG